MIETLPEPFRDERGVIQNLYEGHAGQLQTLGGVAVIASKAGTVRSNHWHREDAHFLYVISGEMHLYERPVGSRDAPRKVVVRAGQMIFTGPQLEHTTVFPVETVMVSLSRQPRDHESHEADLVRCPDVRL